MVTRILNILGMILLSAQLCIAQPMAETQSAESEDAGLSEVNAKQFKKAKDLLEAQKWADAETQFAKLTESKTILREHKFYYLGVAQFHQKKWTEAQTSFSEALKGQPSSKLRNEVSSYQGKLALELKDFATARKVFLALERSTRRTEQYPGVIYDLALAEKGLEKKSASCRWLEKLYNRYPHVDQVKDWGHDLASNMFAEEPTGCPSELSDFRARIRYFLFAGMDQRAQKELDLIKKKLGPGLKADSLQAGFYAQEGEVGKALQLLKPHFEKNKTDYDFLIQFANTAARAGESQLAVGAYYQAYKLQPRSKSGQQSLYQAAFLSYMFQDYDGATRRFQEFMKVYPKSGLTKDAKWHLAWLKYLKGDYTGSYKAMREIQSLKKTQRRAWRSFPQDRLSYWTAMSLLRQGKTAEAKPLFENLAKDPLLGYYSVAAQARLSKMVPDIQPAPAQAPRYPTLGTRFGARMLSSEFLILSLEENFRDMVDDSETEEALAAIEGFEEEASEEAPADDNPDRPISVAEAEAPSDLLFSSPILNMRLDRARSLASVGEVEWARWDFFEIETKTRNPDHLRSLMMEYHEIAQYHRSSYIAQIRFGNQRASFGVEGARSLWEFAYPRAYENLVLKDSKAHKVPSELIWGIMKAESAYRRDAISPVGALGLMQVMPFTGYRVASLLGEKNFAPNQLLEPEFAVKLGSRYLKRLMDKFKDATPLVAAGYNAGPHRVNMWLQNFGKLDTDEFIEHIPFVETRNYVKKVMGNMHVYSQLYNGGKDLFPYLAGPMPIREPQGAISKENWDDI